MPAPALSSSPLPASPPARPRTPAAQLLQFGVKRSLVPLSKRATFVIDTDSRILAVISSELNFDVHADEALAVLRARTS